MTAEAVVLLVFTIKTFSNQPQTLILSLQLDPNVMEKTKSWNTITKIGKRIKKNWKKIADSNKIKINIQGIDALPNFTFNYENNLKYKTFISQEMLKKKILASNAVYCSLAHKENLLNNYFYFFK